MMPATGPSMQQRVAWSPVCREANETEPANPNLALQMVRSIIVARAIGCRPRALLSSAGAEEWMT